MKRVAAQQLPRLRLTVRDLEIIEAVYRYRALTTPQVQSLFFPATSPKQTGKINTRCQYRLQMLYHHGFLERFEQAQTLSEGRLPFVYWLDAKGVEYLIEHGEVDGEEIDWNPNESKVSHMFLDHLLATNDVRVAITLAARKHGYTVLKWIDDKRLKSPQMKDYVTLTGPQGGTAKAAVVPDGFLVLDTGDFLNPMFLEVDLATVTGAATPWERRDWARKVATYLEYYHSGKYQERYGVQGMRILTVTTGDRRLAHLKAVTEKAGGRARFWFTTLEKVRTMDVLTDEIWAVASRESLEKLTR